MVKRTKDVVSHSSSRSGASKEPGPLSRLSIRGPSAHGGFGWVRDLPDTRDVLYAAPLMNFARGLPASGDLRSKCPPIYNQGQLGSCTGNGIAAAIEFDQMKLGKEKFVPSRLFIYYNERVMEGTVNQDAGAQIRDGIKSVATLGAPPESLWPYDIGKFADQPSVAAYAAVGYSDHDRRFIIRNSWGTEWGLDGYCLMPYEYLLNSHLSSDFWTIRSVTG